MGIINPLTIPRGDIRYLRLSQEVDCQASDTVGDPVYIRANIAGGKWQVEAADPDVPAKMPAVGVLISKQSSTTGVVQRVGAVTGVYSGLLAGRAYFVISGGITHVAPSGIEQAIGVAASDDVLWLPGNLSGDEQFDEDKILVERTTGLVMIERLGGNVLVRR